MVGASDLAKMVPGLDFMQSLMKSAGAGIPGLGQWVAPTIDPEELDKRIQDLKTVQFWLEQNARLLATTIQALEVQRMTLSTLQTMNLPLTQLRDALTIKPAPAPEPAAPSTPAPAPAPAPAPQVEAAAAPAPAAAAPAIDPLQWWGALTQQFTELATKAVQDSAAEATRTLAAATPAVARKAAAPAAAPKAAARPAAAKRASAARKRSR